MNVVIWLIVGGSLGWMASVVTRTTARHGIMTNVLAGVVGAFLGGFVMSPTLWAHNPSSWSHLSLPGLLVAFLGAIALVVVVTVLRRVPYR